MTVFCRFLEAEDGEETSRISQHDIAEAVDIMSAQKVKFSPRYTTGLFLLQLN